ncbi:MAG: hypothetical protein A3K61_00175 [Thaumarchaeota archaeon RBG_16_49_8]|nr:MAG: hypothetical protein A3K61_00175 [Thaumarchaeota archaeon RBG_16_49_8]
MGLKKKTSELAHRVENHSVVSNTLRSFSRTSILDVLRDRVLEIVYLIAILLFSSGLINGMIEGSSPYASNFLIYPQSGIQTLPETFIYLFTMLIGSVGMYLLYLGGRQGLRRRIANFYLIFGFSAVIIALSFALFVFDLKM